MFLKFNHCRLTDWSTCKPRLGLLINIQTAGLCGVMPVLFTPKAKIQDNKNDTNKKKWKNVFKICSYLCCVCVQYLVYKHKYVQNGKPKHITYIIPCVLFHARFGDASGAKIYAYWLKKLLPLGFILCRTDCSGHSEAGIRKKARYYISKSTNCAPSNKKRILLMLTNGLIKV